MLLSRLQVRHNKMLATKAPGGENPFGSTSAKRTGATTTRTRKGKKLKCVFISGVLTSLLDLGPFRKFYPIVVSFLDSLLCYWKNIYYSMLLVHNTIWLFLSFVLPKVCILYYLEHTLTYRKLPFMQHWWGYTCHERPWRRRVRNLWITSCQVVLQDS